MDNKIYNINALDIFQNVSKKSIDEISDNAEVRLYNPGHIIFYDKEDVNIIYIVLSGTVSLYKMNENGQKKVIFIFGRGKVINDVIFKDLPASINCEVFERAEILSISKDVMLEIMKNDFELCKNIICSLSMKTRRLYRQLKNTPSSIKLEKKLAAKIYKLAIDYGVRLNNGIYIDMDFTITYIADLLGSQRETVSRAMKVLQKNDLIEYKDKKVYVKDMNKLSEFFKTS